MRKASSRPTNGESTISVISGNAWGSSASRSSAKQLVYGSGDQVGGGARRVRRLARDHVARLEELHEQVEDLGAASDGPLASVDQRLLGEPREGGRLGRVLEQAVEGGVRGLGPAPGGGDEGGVL
jgi:hypothetical protein